MAQQTAVEWLLEAIGYKQESDRTTTINIHPDCDVSDLVERAKQIEKEQIIKARLYGGCIICMDDNTFEDGENYYNREYGKEIDHLKESTCEYSGLRSVQSYEDPKK